jgi:hypothetical protein
VLIINSSKSDVVAVQAKISVELEDEENVKELILDLREAEIDGDFTWMILSYVEDKKNTLTLLETGNGGRKGVAEYLRAEHNGALDKVLYILIKEDDSSNKCTFVCWIGCNVPAFSKASTSTHRGAISNWLSTVVHNVKEEYVQSGNDLLGLKDVEAPRNPQNADGSELAQSQSSGINEVEKKIQSKPYTGKVLDEVKREKTPQEIWMERKQGGVETPRTRRYMSSDHIGSLDNSHIDMLGLGSVEGEKEFAQVDTVTARKCELTIFDELPGFWLVCADPTKEPWQPENLRAVEICQNGLGNSQRISADEGFAGHDES